jgi:ubiquinone/menaquinone biosynthesis C-methylase UbiE
MNLDAASRRHIPMFLRSLHPMDPTSEGQLEDLNRRAATKGWRTALQQVMGNESATASSKVGSLLSSLPLHESSDVLEIGPGLGHLTEALARRVRSVSVLEVVPGRAQFVAERCRQEGLANVWTFIGGDDCRLPFAAATFDVIIVNPSLERCAARFHEGSPADARERLLEEIRFVLRPGGTYHLATTTPLAAIA